MDGAPSSERVMPCGTVVLQMEGTGVRGIIWGEGVRVEKPVFVVILGKLPSGVSYVAVPAACY